MAKTAKKQVSPAKKITRRKNHTTAIVFWVCLILVLAPFCVLGWMLLSSYMDSSSPVLGNRYEGDLDPAITPDQMTQIEEAVQAMEGIDSVKVEMTTATLRVYADIPDDAGADTAKADADAIYSTVAGILDPAVYFTQADGKKMYDLEIHVYNLTEDRDSDAFVYVIDTKTSSMSEPKKQLVSEPVNAELAQQLRDEVTARQEAEAAEEAAAEESSGDEGEDAGSEEGQSEETTEGEGDAQ